ncbi:MAG: hypothetical protein IJX99_08305 [Clostridia bacterium]|nr:hypothetical protein [Clostridia bacterium]
MSKKRVRWRKLDSSAKLFPFVSNKKLSSVYRVSAVLKEKIKPDILQQALRDVLSKHSAFKVTMRRGFFWYYFEENIRNPKVHLENTYPCRYIEKRANRGYPFRVSYYGKKINLEVFHSLTDANTAIKFLQEITYEYIDLVKNKNIEKIVYENVISNNAEDSYLKNYDKEKKKKTHAHKAFNIKGKKLPFGAMGVIHEFIDLNDLKETSKAVGATITEYMSAVLAYSIYLEKYKKQKGKKPIIIHIPVDLKKYYESNTILNFFLFVTIEIKIEKNREYQFEDFLRIVLSEFDKKLTHAELEKAMTTAVKTGTNIITRVAPMPLKKFISHISYFSSRKNITTTISNLGNIKVKDEYKKEIETFLFLLPADFIGNTKCSIVSYGEKLIFTFTSLLADNDIERRFCEILKEKNIKVKTESNGVYEFIS